MRIYLTHSYIQDFYARYLPTYPIPLPSFSRLIVNSSNILDIRTNRTASSCTGISQSNETNTVWNTDNVWLFNVTSDPYEQYNLAIVYPSIVNDLKQKIDSIRGMNKFQQRILIFISNLPIASKPFQQKIWFMYHLENVWSKTHVVGDCSMNSLIGPNDCKFTHPWIPEVQ